MPNENIDMRPTNSPEAAEGQGNELAKGCGQKCEKNMSKEQLQKLHSWKKETYLSTYFGS